MSLFGNRFFVVGTIAFLTATGCARESKELDLESLPTDTVAVYDGGMISIGDVVLAAQALAEQENRGEDADDLEPVLDLIRGLVLGRVLLEDARQSGLAEDPAVQQELLETEQAVALDLYLQQNPIRVEPVTDDDIEVFYQDNLESFRLPARRKVLHIYRRVGPDTTIESLETELGSIRHQVSEGVDFSSLAQTHSDSESRHDGGNLGWRTRDQLHPALADIVFSLEPGKASKPVRTRDGVHLFLVESATESKELGLEDVEDAIRRRLRGTRRRAALVEAVDQLPDPPGEFIVGSEDLGYLLQGGHPTSIVLRSGEYTLRLARFQSMLARRRQEAGGRLSDAESFLRFLALRSKVYHHCLQQGLLGDDAAQEAMAAARDNVLVRTQLRQRLMDEIDLEPARLEAFFQDKSSRFQSPLRLAIQVLNVPLEPDNGNVIMPRLEAVRNDPAPDRLDRVAAELGGSVETLGLLTLADLHRRNPRAARFGKDMTAGSCSPPFRRQSAIEVVQVTERLEPEPLPLATVIDQVRNLYLLEHEDELFQEWAYRVADEVELHILEERLSELFLDPDTGA